MADPYADREQTRAKHFILKSYLQALAFKVLTFSDIAYVDGFSGPWETKTKNFSDLSFMIAISVLKDAQRQVKDRTGKLRNIRCFFSEDDPEAHAQLAQAVAKYHRPQEGFEIKTHEGKFEDAVTEIQSFVAASFALIFIDPTGWTGYPFDKTKPLFARAKCEVLINFMYDFINRFAHSGDIETVESLAPILGGLNWPERLDPPEDFREDCPACVECMKCGEFTDDPRKVDHGTVWCFDCLDNYDGPGDDYYSDFYGGGQATQGERYAEAAREKEKLG